jgi:O-acetyl-ADP-ribose deacetylase (regulator of RNase III)
MIKFVVGDFFDYDADIRVNTVNCVGVMGAGVALLFKNKFPRMYDDYVKACAMGYIIPGKPHVWEDNGLFGSKVTIINFPTKDHWKNPSEYEFIEKGLIWLRSYLQSKGMVTITVPALGCGHGGLDWDRVRPMILQYLGDIEAEVLVFEPKSSTRSLEAEILPLLEEQGIIRITPIDPSYPKKLHGRSSSDIYLKGNQAAFNRETISIVVDSKADERELDAVIECIDILARYNFVFLLGFSSRIEISLVREVLKRNAKVVLVLPYGILQLKIRKDLLDFWDERNVTLVSLASPKNAWSIGESSNALRFRFKVAEIVLIASYNFKSLEKYEKDLIDRKDSIFFINYWNSKIDFFERIRAQQIGKSKVTKLPNLSNILATTSKR